MFLSRNSYRIAVPSNWWQYPYPYDVVVLSGAQGQLQRENLIDSYTESPAKKRKCFDPKIGKLIRTANFKLEYLGSPYSRFLFLFKKKISQ